MRCMNDNERIVSTKSLIYDSDDRKVELNAIQLIPESVYVYTKLDIYVLPGNLR